MKKKNLFCLSTKFLQRPTSTLIPFSISLSIPFPATIGLGSSLPIITFLIPESIIALVHGPVLPEWLHGSRVQINIKSAKDSKLFPNCLFAPSIAFISAWFSPNLSWAPSEMIISSLRIKAPTTGFGFAVYL